MAHDDEQDCELTRDALLDARVTISRVIVFGKLGCLDRAFTPTEGIGDGPSPHVQGWGEKQRMVLSVLRGECGMAEAARRNKCSETSIAKWRDQFVQAGLSALEAGAQQGPSTRGVMRGRHGIGGCWRAGGHGTFADTL